MAWLLTSVAGIFGFLCGCFRSFSWLCALLTLLLLDSVHINNFNNNFRLARCGDLLFRSTSKSRPNNIRGGGNVRPYVRPSVHKKFHRFQ